MRECSPFIPGKTRLSVSLALFAALLLLAPSASAQTINNGSFDAQVPSNGTGGGWTSANIDFAGGWRDSGGDPGARFILNDAGQAGTDPTLTQLVTGLLTGATYQITGRYGSAIIGQNTGATQAFGVAINGTFLFESPGITDFDYRTFSFNFVAPSDSVTLSLSAERNGTDNDFKVDTIGISLVDAGAAAPEPGTLSLVVGGFIGLAAIARRRKG